MGALEQLGGRNDQEFENDTIVSTGSKFLVIIILGGGFESLVV